MDINIIKRTGEVVQFNHKKIINAISKAYHDVREGEEIPWYAEKIANEVYEVAEQNESPLTVEEIQELVEDYLTDYDRLVAKAYIRYRYKRGVMRACSDEFIRSISEKLQAKNVQNQNANVDEHSFGGRVGEASDEMMKQYALDFCVSPMARANHLNNEIYIHDLSAYAVGMHNCLSIPFDKLLAEGFNTRQTDVRPANSINTAFQLVAVIFQLQSLMQFGGVSATHLDWTMVPYVRKSFWKHFKDGLKWLDNDSNGAHFFLGTDVTKMPIEPYNHPSTDPQTLLIVQTAQDMKAYKYAMEMTERELQQAVEGMYHNLNTL